jgi:chemotaxis protein histidine kinase CheA
LKQFDIIIKPLDEEAGKIKGIAGAAELSSGGIAIILDIEALLGKSFV